MRSVVILGIGLAIGYLHLNKQQNASLLCAFLFASLAKRGGGWRCELKVEYRVKSWEFNSRMDCCLPH